MRTPRKYTIQEIKDWEVQTECSGEWKLARPLNLKSWRKSVKLAYGVLVGKYDVLDWQEQKSV